jgi:hypothetical protein
MHEQLMKRESKRLLSRENIGIVIGMLITLALATITDRRGMPHKWHTAIFGTILPFMVVILSFPLRWKRLSFWAAFTICLAIHTVTIWIFFQYALLNVRTFGLLLWLPVAFVETFVLFVAVKRVEEKLTGKNESYKLD